MPFPLVVALASALPVPELPGEPLPPNTSARYGSLYYRVPGPVYASALSPDGKLLAVVGPVVRVYEVPAWRPVRQFQPPPGGVLANPRALAFSPNGQFLAYHRSGGAVLVWDVAENKLVRHLKAASDWRYNPLLAFTPDGLLALADADKLYLLDPVTGAEVRTAPAGNVVHLSPDGNTFVRLDKPKPPPGVIVVGGDAGEAAVGDARTGKDGARLGTHFQTDSVNHGLAFAPDGRTFALVRPDGMAVEVRDAGTGKVAATITPPGPVYPADKKGPTVSIGGAGGPGAGGPDVGFSPDGKELFVRLADGDVCRWAADGRKELPRLKAGSGPRPIAVHALPDGKTLLTPTGEGWVRVWDAATGAERPIPGRYRGRVRVTASPGGAAVAVADDSGRLDLRDAATGKLVRVVRGPGRGPGFGGGAAFSPDGRRLAFVDDGPGPAGRPPGGLVVRVAGVADGADLGAVAGEYNLYPVGFAADGELIAVEAGPAGKVAVRSLGTGKVAREFGPAGNGAAVSPDGRLLAAYSGGEVAVWDAVAGRELRRVSVGPPVDPPGRPGQVYLTWAGDGRTLAVARSTGDVVLLDPGSGRAKGGFTLYAKTDPAGLKEQLRAGRPVASSAHLSPDGKWLLAAGPGADVVWEAATGMPAATLTPGPWGGGGDARFTPDGRALVAAHPGYADRIELVRTLARPSARPPEDLWGRAADAADAGKATQAAFALVADADGRAFVREKLPPAKPDPAAAGRVKGWVADLKSDDFDTRETASKELAARAREVESALREALAAADGPEVRRRLEVALRAADRGPTPDEVRALRLVHAAELSGTPECRDLLTAWAGGAAGAVLTEDARAAVARLDARDRAGRK